MEGFVTEPKDGSACQQGDPDSMTMQMAYHRKESRCITKPALCSRASLSLTFLRMLAYPHRMHASMVSNKASSNTRCMHHRVLTKDESPAVSGAWVHAPALDVTVHFHSCNQKVLIHIDINHLSPVQGCVVVNDVIAQLGGAGPESVSVTQSYCRTYWIIFLRNITPGFRP